jgi:hypothetical protein
MGIVLCGCGPPSDPEDRTVETFDNAALIEQSKELRACVERVVVPPWRVIIAQVQTTGPVVQLEAASADLRIRHRASDIRGQLFVDVGLGRFNGPRILDFEGLPSLIDRGTLVAAETVRGKAASEFAPFVPFAQPYVNAIVFVNAPAREVCEIHNERMSWPNPQAQCEVVAGGFASIASFSADAIDDLPRVFASIRAAIDPLLPCVEPY